MRVYDIRYTTYDIRQARHKCRTGTFTCFTYLQFEFFAIVDDRRKQEKRNKIHKDLHFIIQIVDPTVTLKTLTMRDPRGYITSPPSAVVKVIGTARDDINGLLGIAISYNIERERYLVHMTDSQVGIQHCSFLQQNV